MAVLSDRRGIMVQLLTGAHVHVDVKDVYTVNNKQLKSNGFSEKGKKEMEANQH